MKKNKKTKKTGKSRAGISRKEFTIKGMECTSCEKIITDTANSIKGVVDVKTDYVKGQGIVRFNPKKTNTQEIFTKINKQGYICEVSDGSSPKKSKINYISLSLGLVVLIAAAYFLTSGVEFSMPALDQNTSLALIFIIGLLTGFHCIAMCGGFVVSYSTKSAKNGKTDYGSHITYGISKTFSYAFFGAIFGFVGSFFTFTPFMRGAAAVLAGLFLVLFGLNMLDLLIWFRRFRLKTPDFVGKLISSTGGRKNRSPMILGLLNGLMIACGPLQAIYLFAAASGSAYYGALYLAVFGLGTLPVLLGFGLLTSIVSSKFTSKLVRYSGVIVIILGLVMMNRGLALTGTGYDLNTFVTSVSALDGTSGDGAGSSSIILKDGYQEIYMNVTRYGWSPDKFILKKGVTVKWIIDGQELTYCNDAIQVPKLGLNFDVEKGRQVIEFTPSEEGVIPWSCWMGMIPGVFIVKENINVDDTIQIEKELAQVQVPQAGSCGGSCGSPTCGAANGGSCGCGG